MAYPITKHKSEDARSLKENSYYDLKPDVIQAIEEFKKGADSYPSYSSPESLKAALDDR